MDKTVNGIANICSRACPELKGKQWAPSRNPMHLHTLSKHENALKHPGLNWPTARSTFYCLRYFICFYVCTHCEIFNRSTGKCFLFKCIAPHILCNVHDWYYQQRLRIAQGKIRRILLHFSEFPFVDNSQFKACFTNTSPFKAYAVQEPLSGQKKYLNVFPHQVLAEPELKRTRRNDFAKLHTA